MQAVIFGKLYKESHREIIETLFDSLAQHGVTCYIFQPYFEEIKDHVKIPAVCGLVENWLDFRLKKFDVLLCLGGDGTMLSAVNLVRDSGVLPLKKDLYIMCC